MDSYFIIIKNCLININQIALITHRPAFGLVKSKKAVENA